MIFAQKGDLNCFLFFFLYSLIFCTVALAIFLVQKQIFNKTKIFRSRIYSIFGSAIFTSSCFFWAFFAQYIPKTKYKTDIIHMNSVFIKIGIIWLIFSSLLAIASNSKKDKNRILFLTSVFACMVFGLNIDISHFLSAFDININHWNISLYFIISNSCLFYALWWICRILIRRSAILISLSGKINKNDKSLVKKLVKIVLVTFFSLCGLNLSGFDLKTLAIVSSAIGVGVGFGLQKIASNFISGIILVFEKSIKEGDIIELKDGTSGLIRELCTRYTLIDEFDGKKTLVPNEYLVTSNVTNLTYSEKKSRLKFYITLEYNTNIELAERIILNAIAKNHFKHPTERELFVVEKLGESGIVCFFYIWIKDICDKNEATSQLFKEILKAFFENNIKLAPKRLEIVNENFKFTS